jgi:hypothetical protein
MWKRLQTLAFVVVVTGLIWVFAESESLTRRTLEVEVNFTAAGEVLRAVRVSDPTFRGRVQLEIVGSTSAVTEMERRLSKPLALRPGGEVFPTEPGERTLDLREILRRTPGLGDRGVTFARVEPPTIRVILDELREVQAKVVVEVADGELDGPAEVLPPTVTLRAPVRLLASADSDPIVTARIERAALTGMVPGRAELVKNVALKPGLAFAGDPDVGVVPPQADVRLKLLSRTTSLQVASVPVHIQVAAEEFNLWEVRVRDTDRFIRDVRVTGPADVVDQVRRGEIKLRAVVALSFEELEQGVASKDAMFSQLPSMLRVEAASRTVRFEVRRLTPGAPSAAPAAGESPVESAPLDP